MLFSAIIKYPHLSRVYISLVNFILNATILYFIYSSHLMQSVSMFYNNRNQVNSIYLPGYQHVIVRQAHMSISLVYRIIPACVCILHNSSNSDVIYKQNNQQLITKQNCLVIKLPSVVQYHQSYCKYHHCISSDHHDDQQGTNQSGGMSIVRVASG